VTGDATNGAPEPGSLRRLRSRAAPLAKTALLRLGGYAAVRRVMPSGRAAILRYHAICGDEGYSYADPTICITPSAFEDHARYLATHYAVLPLAEMVDRFRARRPLPRNAVAITFDDGYADNLAAARTLNRFGLTATFFITAGCLDGGHPFWPAELRRLLATSSAPTVRIDVSGCETVLTVATPEQRRVAARTVSRIIKSHPMPVRESILAQLRGAARSGATPRCMLRWEEAAEMQRLGMTIGAHTLTHPNLPSAGLAAAADEIAGSKALLERELGGRVTLFSYPNGGAERYYTTELQRLVAESGYDAAASSRNAFATPASDLYALERIEVEERLEDLVFALEIERFVFSPAAKD
jgi:peptidoglycan/xylan/chitin deacetylase (PgdA/CDA1 family)